MSRSLLLQVAICFLCVSSGFTQEPTFPVVNPVNYWLTDVPGTEGCGIYEHNGENHLFGMGWWDDETHMHYLTNAGIQVFTAFNLMHHDMPAVYTSTACRQAR